MNFFEIINFGSAYYPSPDLKKDLKKIIIFTENNTRRGIPNGAVLVYQSDDYNPEILKSDVGCGITAVVINGLVNDSDDKKLMEQFQLEVLKAVDELGIHIGQGDHFLDITTAHPLLAQQSKNSQMLFLHSDFNNTNFIPRTYQEAKDLEARAKDKRIEYLYALSRLLGVSAEIYRDWTHNSVVREDGLMIYRKGAINLMETENVGLIAISPVSGLFLYVARFEEYFHSMQHATGRIGSKSKLLRLLLRKQVGSAIGYRIPWDKIDNIEPVESEVYNTLDSFIEHFCLHHEVLGVCVPYLIVTTKGTK